MTKNQEVDVCVGARGEPAEYAEVPGHDPAVQPPPGRGAEGQVTRIYLNNEET